MWQNQDILIAEELLRTAMICGDTQAMSDLIDDSFVFTSPMGNSMKKGEYLEQHSNKISKIVRMDLFEIDVHHIYSIIVTTTKVKIEATYDENPISGIFVYTRIWHDRQNRLRVVASHCSEIDTYK